MARIAFRRARVHASGTSHMKAKFFQSSVVGAALLLFPGLSARAVDIDLSGKVLKPGGSIAVTSTTAVPTSLVYQVNLSGTGTSTGSFVPLIADGDFQTAVAAINPYFGMLLSVTLADLTGKFPVTLGAQEGFAEANNVPITAGTTGTLIVQGRVSLAINKHGFVTAKVSKMSFAERNNSGGRVRFSGTYTISSGDLSVAPLVATSGTAQPGIIALINTHFCLAGGGAPYQTASPGNTNQVSLRPGTSVVTFFIMQNNGPATDNYVLQADPFPTDISADFYDGKTNITSQVTGTGYPINSFPSSGLKAIKVKVIVGSHAPKYDNGFLTFRLFRSADPSELAYGGVQFYVR